MTIEEKRRVDWVSLRLGLGLRAQRKKHRWNQTALARRLGVHRNQISRYETGAVEITVQDFVRLCDLFGCDPGAALQRAAQEPMHAFRPVAAKDPVPSLEKLVAERDPMLTLKERRA